MKSEFPEWIFHSLKFNFYHRSHTYVQCILLLISYYALHLLNTHSHTQTQTTFVYALNVEKVGMAHICEYNHIRKLQNLKGNFLLALYSLPQILVHGN